MLLNTRFKSYNYSINYKNLDFNDNSARITVLVDIDYEYENGVKGGLRDIDYEFNLEKRDEGWIITNLESNYDEFQDFKNRVDEKKKVMRGETKEIIDSCRDDEIERIKNYKKKPSLKNVFGDKDGCGHIKTDIGVKYACEFALKNKKDRLFYTAGNSDCTNFVSQCLHAGNIPITNSWRPYSTSWIRVNELYHYLIKNAIGVNITSKHPYKEGDVIQFYANSKGYFSHSGVITKSLGYGEYLYCCHSYDKLNFPLSEIFPFMYDKIRVIQPK